jgi:hypothetical protein
LAFWHNTFWSSKNYVGQSKFGVPTNRFFVVSPNIFLRNQDSLFLFMRHVEPKKAFSKFTFSQTLALNWKLWLWIEILWRAKKNCNKFNFWSHWRLFYILKYLQSLKPLQHSIRKDRQNFFCTFRILGSSNLNRQK